MIRLMLVLWMGVVMGACGGKRVDPDREPLQPFQAVTYIRTGGLAGAEDRLMIAEDGTVTTSGRLFGNGSSKLTEFQLLQLARIFEGWERLEANYPAPPEARDAFTVAITFGTRTVTATDASANVPPLFQTARQRLEQIARTLPAARGQ